ncbi:MAG: glycosyltransferase family 39 protein [Sumerlaeia bacterium]
MLSHCLKKSPIASPNRLLLAALLLVWGIRFLTLGLYPIFDTTEARYAEIPREMVSSGDWITPQLDPGLPFWGKPPLSFWITAVSFRVFGFSEFSARLPHLLVSLFAVLLVYVTAKRLFGGNAGLLAALILSTTGLFYALSAGIMTDPTLATCVTLAMCGFVLSLFGEGSEGGRRFWGYLFFAGAGLAMLAKGPVGLVLIALPIGLWLIAAKQWKRAAVSLPWLGGPLLFLAIVLPWYLLAEAKTPGFLDYFIVGEHFKRFLVPGWEGDMYGNPHEHPRGTIWLFGALSILPWGLYLAPAFWGLRREPGALRTFVRDPLHLFFLLWFLSPLIFFTFSGNIILTYVLPGLSGFALLGLRIAGQASRASDSRPATTTRFVHRPAFHWALAGFTPVMFLFAALAILPALGERKSHKSLVEALPFFGAPSGTPLYYFEDMPYSADLYSGGNAHMIPEDSVEEWLRITGDDIPDFIVVDEDDLDNLDRVTGRTYVVLMRHDEDLLVTEGLPAAVEGVSSRDL